MKAVLGAEVVQHLTPEIDIAFILDMYGGFAAQHSGVRSKASCRICKMSRPVDSGLVFVHKHILFFSSIFQFDQILDKYQFIPPSVTKETWGVGGGNDLAILVQTADFFE